MYRVVIGQLRSHPLRFALTTFGVTLAVSFVVASLVIRDGVDTVAPDIAGDVAIFRNVLLGFSVVSIVIATMIVYNTFTMALGHRLRELALLRTIGASPAQVARCIIGEAFAVGALASALGIPAGVFVARGVEAVFNATGEDMPNFPTIISTRTIGIALGLGVGVTFLAALRPARQASTVPADVARRGPTDHPRAIGPSRVAVGLIALAIGVAAAVFAASTPGSSETAMVVLAVGLFSAVAGLSLVAPAMVRLFTARLAWPLERLSRVTGRLASRNAARNPRRTASTATALMAGLAMVTSALVVGQSVKNMLRADIADSLVADYFFNLDNDGTVPLDTEARLAESGVVGAVTGFRFADPRVDGVVVSGAAADFHDLDAVYKLRATESGLMALTGHRALVSIDNADRLGVEVGDIIGVEFSNGAEVTTTITGTFEPNALISTDFIFNASVFDAGGDQTGYSWLALSTSPSATPDAVSTALTAWRSDFPGTSIEDTKQVQLRVAGLIDDALIVVNFLIALATTIAMLGVANTMALSMLERTRELGLMRIVGMSRRQLRHMVLIEAALVTLFGAALGVAIGLVFGPAAALALPGAWSSTPAIPLGPIAMLMVAAAAAGVIAAALPARRAARSDLRSAMSS